MILAFLSFKPLPDLADFEDEPITIPFGLYVEVL